MPSKLNKDRIDADTSNQKNSKYFEANSTAETLGKPNLKINKFSETAL